MPRSRYRTRVRTVLAFVTIKAVLAGCAVVEPVAPWQKGNLARPDMTFEWDKLDTDFMEHTYSSKEGASGGAGVGGGGCGCN